MGSDNDKEDRQKWHDRLDDVWDLTDRTFDKLQNAVNDWNGDTLPWINAAFGTANATTPEEADKLWAFPVPSARQYDQCKSAGGKSVWNQDGVWRCLFGNKADHFSDYNSYLNWRGEMQKNVKAEREKKWSERHHKCGQFGHHWGVGKEEKNSTQDIKYITEADAEKSNKRVISSTVTSESFTDEDGTLQTRKLVKKWYDDGTASVNESTSKGDLKAGWFWK